MSHKSLEIRDRRNFYLDEGTGEPIVLLHCSSGSSSAWKPVIARLSEDYRALAPDLLGYGRNATWPRGAVLRLDDELAVVEALLDLAGRFIWSDIPMAARSRSPPHSASRRGLPVSRSLSPWRFTC
jgi:pimeloyl-ACP methyl ester carboxylesterase